MAVLELVNEITHIDDVHGIGVALKKKLKWIVGSIDFLILRYEGSTVQLLHGDRLSKISNFEKCTSEVPLLFSLFGYSEKVSRFLLKESPELFSEISSLTHEMMVHEIFSVKASDGDRMLMLFLNDKTFSKNESLQLNTLANVVMGHIKKIELFSKEQQRKLDLEKSLCDLKNAQKQLVHQEQLSKSESRHKALIEATSAIVWVTNPKGEFVEEQEEWVKFTGQNFEEHRGYGWSDALHPNCRAHCVSAWEQALKTGSNLLTEGQLWSQKHQCYRYIEVFAAPISNDTGEVIEWIGNVLDVTDRLFQKAKLESTVQELKEAIEVRSKLLANVSHEIRTPLNSIIGFSDIAIEEDDPKLLGQYLRTIHQTSESLLSLLNDILDFSRFECDQVKLNVEEFCLESLIKEIIDSVTLQVNPKRVSLSFIAGGQQGQMICLDRSKLKQVISNLVFNSVKFTEEGFIKVEARCEREKVWIEVKDSGVGIEEQNVSKIFNEFEQEDLSTIKKYKGVGLGLSIVKSIVELMDGKIKCESKKGEGASFMIELPLKEACLKSAVDKSSIAKTVELPLRILVVDDSQDNLLLMDRYFSKTVCHVDFVDNGPGAIDLVSKNTFDVIFMDIQMPDMDGYEATRRIRTLEKENSIEGIYIVALSAHVHQSNIDQMMSSGCDDHIAKPIKKKELFHYLNTVFPLGKG